MTKNEALAKNEELKKFVENEDQEFVEFVKIDYSVIPQSLFEKYGVKPFEIMKRKMRNFKGEVWNGIDYFNAQTECEKRGFRLPNLREILMFLEFYKNSKDVSPEDSEFLGIQELSLSEDVYFEWVYFLDSISFLRGGNWDNGANAGAFALNLDDAPSDAGTDIGFRCVRNLIIK